MEPVQCVVCLCHVLPVHLVPVYHHPVCSACDATIADDDEEAYRRDMADADVWAMGRMDPDGGVPC